MDFTSAAEAFQRINALYLADRGSWDWIGIRSRWRLLGPDGGDWDLDLRDGSGVSRETSEVADCEVEMQAEQFLELIRGELNPQLAFQKGTLRAAGKRFAVLKLNFLFDKFRNIR